MRTQIIKICLTVLILAICLNARAADSPVPAEVKEQMRQEIIRGGNEVFNCSMGLTSDKEIADCLSSVLDLNIQHDTDTAPFLAGAYFIAFARLAVGSSTPGIRDKWLATCLRRLSEIEKGIGFTDKELAEITQNVAILPEIEKMRLSENR
jgi:hypothetical protein